MTHIREATIYEARDYELTDRDIQHVGQCAWNLMYADHAGAALETPEELKLEHEATCNILMWFMKRHNLHISPVQPIESRNEAHYAR